MNTRLKVMLCGVAALAVGALTVTDVLARGGGRGGGGGGRSGGGGGYRGGGAVRSSPSVSRAAASRPSSVSRSTYSSSRPDVGRPASAYSGSSYGSQASRPSTASRPATASRPSSVSRVPAPVTIPATASRPSPGRSVAPAQSRVQSPVTVPGRTPGVGDRGSGAVRPATAAASRAGTTSLPSRSKPLSTARPQNYGSISRAGAAAGLTAAGVTAGAVAGASRGDVRSAAARGDVRGDVDRGTTVRGGDWATVDGPRGELGVIRGPAGGGAAVAQGPGGETVGALRGPRGNTMVRELPDGWSRNYYGGHDYYCHGHYWYAPYWYNDYWYYEYRYPPVNYWYSSLPERYETVVVDTNEYYVADSVYYVPATKDGVAGYAVAAPPATNSTGRALAVLQRTCDFLGAATSLTATAEVTMERYLETGDKVPETSMRHVRIQQPDRMALTIAGPSQNLQIVYDGKSLTVTELSRKKQISVGAKPRLEDEIVAMGAQYGFQMPVGDLLQRDAFDTLSLGFSDATYVDVSEVGGVPCDHVAFRQDAIDWELWVSQGDQPLPMKVVILYREEPNNPRYVWECKSWDVNQPQPPDAFAVEQPAPPAVGG